MAGWGKGRTASYTCQSPRRGPHAVNSENHAFFARLPGTSPQLLAGRLYSQARYVHIVAGGGLRVGSPGQPFAGTAMITLTGAQGDGGPQLPPYGSKLLLVQDGSLELYGRLRNPPYASLAATALAGDTSILVNAPINATVNVTVNWSAVWRSAIDWQPGERLVLATSSFFADEVDETTIADVAPTDTPGVVRLTLTSALSYAHLGVVVTPPLGSLARPGDALPLDMRCVVALLSRNVVLRGDDGSLRTSYGGQVRVWWCGCHEYHGCCVIGMNA
jgi:hypothetical protein